MSDDTSPCILVCVLDPVSGFCIGCGRTGAEIGGWLGMGREDRVALKALLPARLAGMTTRAVREGGRRARPSAR